MLIGLLRLPVQIEDNGRQLLNLGNLWMKLSQWLDDLERLWGLPARKFARA